MASMYEVDGDEMKQRLQNDYYQQQEQQAQVQQAIDGAGQQEVQQVQQQAGPVGYGSMTTPELASMLQQEVNQTMGMPYGYGHQMMPQQLYGMPSMPAMAANGGVLEEEPLYVNAKQYNRILKRRQARARLEAQMKQSREKAPYMHESRHRHAMNRPRGPGGRFLTAAEIAEMKAQQGKEESSSKATAETSAKRVKKDSTAGATDDDSTSSSNGTEPNGRAKAKTVL